ESGTPASLLGLKGEARRRHPRQPPSVSRAAAVRALGGAKRLAAPLLRPFEPSAEAAAVDDAKLRAADAQAHLRHAPGRRGPHRGRRLRRPISYLGASRLQPPPPSAVRI
ncbi:unnamed protein product, partial [Urochloa humidicola]